MMKNFQNKNQDPSSRKKSRLGGYSVALICIVLAVLVTVNLIVGEIPTKYTHIDVSELQLYSLSEKNLEYLHALDQDVTLYLVTQSGTDNNDLYEILTKYASESSHIRLVVKDPALYPNFVSQYTSDTLTNNSVIVESGDKSKVVDFSDIFALDYTAYYTTGQASYTYNGETLITGAIDYVTREDLPVLYTISGHGETALSDNMRSTIENKNYTVQELSLLSADAIPEDCDILLMDSPTQDISAAEAEVLMNYLENGGRLLLFTAATDTEFSNLMRVTESYGMTMQNGILCDSDSGHYMQNYFMLLPDKVSHEITSEQISEGTYTLVPVAHGISILEQYRSTVSINPLLVTSESAYLKADPDSVETLEKETGDLEGSFYPAVAAEETYNDTTTRLVWYATSLYNLEYYDDAIGGANTELILSSLGWLYGETSAGVSLPAKSLTSDSSMTLSAQQSLIWIMLMVVLIPVGLLVCGLVYWLRRRKR